MVKHFFVALLTCFLLALSSCSSSTESPTASVQLVRLPESQIQPRIVIADGVMHRLTYSGESAGGDLFYSRSEDGLDAFSEPIRVNSQESTAISGGTIRGGEMAIGPHGEVHVVWNGSSTALPKGPLNPEQADDSPYNGTPFLYARMTDDGEFTPQRNLMTKTFALDGGGTIAADSEGNVYAAWHGSNKDAAKGEAGRQVWLARSTDGGSSFSAEEAISDPAQGACGCCSSHLFAGDNGHLALFYRTAREIENRDGYLLTSSDYGKTFSDEMLQPWTISACPMSSASFADGPAGLLLAWETAGQIWFAPIDSAAGKTTAEPVAAPGTASARKHPSLAQNARGETLLVWTAVEGWGQGGKVFWQLFDDQRMPIAEIGSTDGLPAWSFAAAITLENGNFAIIY